MRRETLDSDPYDLDLLARDQRSESITALTECLDTTGIFDGNGLEFTLATEDIQSLVETYNQLKPSDYPGVLSSSLGSKE